MFNKKKKVLGRVMEQQQIAPDIYDLWIETELAKSAAPGQFVGVYPKNQATLLPRPISICEINQDKTCLRLVYRVAGAGTAEFASRQPGEELYLLGILGNGFPVREAKGKQVFLIGGGIGIPPMLELAKVIQTCGSGTVVTVFAGYRDRHLFLAKDMERYGTLYAATEDGSRGTQGTVMDAIRESGLKPGVMMACGPLPMLRAVKAYALEQSVPAFLSLEERMACGVGACLGCVCKTRGVHHHSHVNNARICTDGPVFEAREVEI